LIKTHFLFWREINRAHKFFKIWKFKAHKSSKPTSTKVNNKQEDDAQVVDGREENTEGKYEHKYIRRRAPENRRAQFKKVNLKFHA